MRRLLAVYVLVTALWVADLAAAPWLAAHLHAGDAGFLASALTYRLGALVCHQQAGRSFHLGSVQLPVCARCTGLYAGAPIGAIAVLVWVGEARRRVRLGAIRAALFASAVPTAVVWMLEWGGGVRVGNLARAVAALPLGAMVSWVAAAWIAGFEFGQAAGAGDRAEHSGVD